MKILNEVETLDKLLAGYSIARFGDGEIILCQGKNIIFQNSNPSLQNYLVGLIHFDLKHDKLLIAIPPQILGEYDRYIYPVRKYWKTFNSHVENFKQKYLKEDETYASSFITRISEITASRKNFHKKIIIKKFKELWKNKKIVYLLSSENKTKWDEKINLFFNNAKQLEYLYIPHENAFESLDVIMNSVTSKFDNSNLILCTAGPTATVLAYKFTLLGYQFIDFGQIFNLVDIDLI